MRAFQVLGAEALGCTPSYALYLADWCRERGIDPRELGVRAVLGRRRAGRRRGRDPARDRGGVRRHRARGDGDRRRLAVAVGRVRGAGRHALLRRGPRPRRADRPRDRRAAAVRGRRRGRARLHLAAPRGDAGAALPQPRPRGGQREAVLVRARRAARALHRPHRRPADRPRRQPLPDRAARGGRGVPPARRRPDPDPARARRRPPGRAAAGAGRAGEEGGADADLAGAIRDAIRTPLVVTTAVELVPYGTLAAERVQEPLVDFSVATSSASGGDPEAWLRGDAEQRRVAVGALDHVVGRALGSSRPLRMPK